MYSLDRLMGMIRERGAKHEALPIKGIRVGPRRVLLPNGLARQNRYAGCLRGELSPPKFALNASFLEPLLAPENSA